MLILRDILSQPMGMEHSTARIQRKSEERGSAGLIEAYGQELVQQRRSLGQILQSALNVSSRPKVSRHTSWGIVSVRLFWSTCSTSILRKLPNSTGTPPVKEFSARKSNFAFDPSKASSAGIVPDKPQPTSDKLSSSGKEPKPFGMVPATPGLSSSHNSTNGQER